MNDLTVESAEQQSSKVIEDAKRASNITDQQGYKAAGDLLVKIRTIRKHWKEVINPIKSKAYDTWKQACATENKVDEPFALAEEILIHSLAEFHKKSNEERKSQEAEQGLILPSLERIEGLNTMETWSCEVENLMSLIESVAKGYQPSIYLEPNMKVLNQQARSLKDMLKIPGCKAVKKTGYQVRTT